MIYFTMDCCGFPGGRGWYGLLIRRDLIIMDDDFKDVLTMFAVNFFTGCGT